MQEGEKCHILCSQKVGDEVIEHLSTMTDEYVLKNEQ